MKKIEGKVLVIMGDTFGRIPIKRKPPRPTKLQANAWVLSNTTSMSSR